MNRLQTIDADTLVVALMGRLGAGKKEDENKAEK